MSVSWPADGKRVCVVGRGTANSIHYHGVLTRRTKTMIMVRQKISVRDIESRFQIDTGRMVGGSEWGGAYAAPTCQRKPEKAKS